jgi:hypothetical protein
MECGVTRCRNAIERAVTTAPAIQEVLALADRAAGPCFHRRVNVDLAEGRC